MTVRQQRFRPQPLLFGAATLYAMLALPLWVLAREVQLRWAPARFVSGDWHGYEMLFGYAFAVVAGFLIGPIPRWTVAWLLLVWLVARAGALVAPFGPVHSTASALFGLSVASLASVKLFRGPSKLRNRMLAPVVLGLSAIAAIAPFAGGMRMRLFVVALDLFVVLLAFMGGRLIAAAAAGHFYRRGQNLQQRVQPRLEGVLLAGLLLLAVCDLVAAPELVCSAVAVAAAVLLALRWSRWHLWTCLDWWNLAALGVGYLWLAIGLALRATRSLSVWILPVDALHALTVGALGSVTLLVMGRTRAMNRGFDPERSAPLAAGAALVNLAALLRLAAGVLHEARLGLLLGAATLWTLAFATLAGFMWRLRSGEPATRVVG